MKKSMKKAFTLVEVLIVLVVIGIIVAVVVPNTLSAIRMANIRDTAATLRAIDTAAGLCFSQNGNWTACNTIGELTPFLERAPGTSPSSNQSYTLTGDDINGWMSAKNAHFNAWPNMNSAL